MRGILGPGWAVAAGRTVVVLGVAGQVLEIGERRGGAAVVDQAGVEEQAGVADQGEDHEAAGPAWYVVGLEEDVLAAGGTHYNFGWRLPSV